MGDTHPKAMAGTPDIIQDDTNLKIYKYPNGVAIYSEGNDIWKYAPDINGLSNNMTSEISNATNDEEREKIRTKYYDSVSKFKKLFGEAAVTDFINHETA